MNILDCTLRDGGYYNSWNFERAIVDKYLNAMSQLGVDVVELGLRSSSSNGFAGANAYTTDDYIRSLDIPDGLIVGVMINAVELVKSGTDREAILKRMFPEPAGTSPVQLVRIASHVHEFEAALPACAWLKSRGFRVGFNLMQVADRSQAEVEALAAEAAKWPLDVLYFADSMGSMNPEQTAQIIGWLRKYWNGPLGIHTHDNMGLALQNTLRALDEGVSWLDSTVTGMGRGPGNAKTEQLVLEIAERRGTPCNIVPLMGVIRDYFQPLQQRCGWGTNPYYYLAGKYGIHPTYIQEMMGDSRYSDEDIVAVIEHLRVEGGKKFSLNTLDAARNFYQGPPRGSWRPDALIKGRDVLVLGTGPGVAEHRAALERYIRRKKPFVMALNTQSQLDPELIDVRVACHPVRLLADCEQHTRLPQPLVTPASMLPEDVKAALTGKELLDFGLGVQVDQFVFAQSHCIVPTSLVFAYALAVASSGQASRIYLAGFDGYGADDPRSAEVQRVLTAFEACDSRPEVYTVTPSRYTLSATSIYAM
ncbi:aldolase catalytic domain-containing protein [Stutzerimonas stutzeri]|uniref:aldolase catalytic domain-containing protein n=1 Tax=Stutzerimonas stutzeri TaxID=316 RepID=UPI001CFCC417|nr:aldolase catalytic domain-containing protein [Stutzerimonas stutzeri]